MAEIKQDILEKLADLHHQATGEKSHYYVGRVVREAIIEIMKLREEIATRKFGKIKEQI